MSGSDERLLPFSAAIVWYTSLCLTPKKMLAPKAEVKTLDNQMEYSELLVKEAYDLCRNLKQMLHHFFERENASQYKRVEIAHDKAMKRYLRRWGKLTSKVMTK